MNTALQVHRDGPVAHVILDRADRRNAFDAAVVSGLTSVFMTLSTQPELRAVVLRAAGPTFCAGADLHWMQSMAEASHDDNLRDARQLANMLWAIDHCPVPVIAAVQGDCHGGGVGLVAACDIALAVPEAGFSLSEVRLGLVPATISPYVLRALGERAARRYMLTAERIDAQRALDLGLVHDLCSAEQLQTRAHDLARTIAGHGPHAVRTTKRLIRDVCAQPAGADLRDDTARCIADIRTGPEGQAGIQAFLQRTVPPWRLPETP